MQWAASVVMYLKFTDTGAAVFNGAVDKSVENLLRERLWQGKGR
ncbi:MAG: hypothetical protein Q4F06_01910 [Eubacteriales bacterium]|nr:hypothetical protein [Eubacteriales bacterium]